MPVVAEAGPATALPFLQPDCVIGGYSFLKQLGHGSFGEVWQASKDGKQFAIKKVYENDKGSEMEIFYAESIKLLCPYLVNYRGTFSDPRYKGNIFIVMEYCGQGDLKMLIRRLSHENGAALTPQRLMRIMIQTLIGLNELHNHKIIHRDLKPENIFVDEKYDIKIGDLGLGKEMDGSDGGASSRCGSLIYMAPEILGQGRDELNQYNTKADIWSLGVIMYELCTFEVPFRNEKDILKGNFKPIPDLSYSDEIIALVVSCLCVDPSNRPSAMELLNQPVVRKFATSLNITISNK